MSILNPVFQQLIYGDRSAFAFVPSSSSNIEVSPIAVTDFLATLAEDGYEITNAQNLFNLNVTSFLQFREELNAVISSSSKEGVILRKTFGEDIKLTPYTDEDWRAILAQYAITYGWAATYEERFGTGPVGVLSAYIDSMPTHITELATKGKQITIWEGSEIRSFIKSILESKSVLRNQQIQVLKVCNARALADIAAHSHITIKETLTSVANLLIHTTLYAPLLRSPTDVLRFITTNYVESPIEGQITKAALKETKMHIPTSVRKFLLQNLELLAQDRGWKYLTEDMFNYADFWKRIDKYLRFTKMRIMRARYPIYTDAIDNLYLDDRSWTFNGRYSAAKEAMQYEDAAIIAMEKPGFFIRNLLEFMRMKKGVTIPKKISNSPQPNPMDKLLGKDSTVKENKVLSDAFHVIKSNTFTTVLNKSNPKLLWQLFEMLQDEAIYLPVTSRMIQGQLVNYSSPMPGVDKQIAQHVLNTISTALSNTLRPRNEKLGKVYFPNLGFKIQYSGRKETSIALSGQYLPTGTKLAIADLLNDSYKLKPMIRLGVMWRGRSVDLDHSVIAQNEAIYYGKPQLTKRGTTIITSSGDITTCTPKKFSVECVDIDVLECYNNQIFDLIQSVIVYSGNSKLCDNEVYFFINIIDMSERVTGNQVTIALDKVDYAIRIDPNSTEKAGAQIGTRINIRKGIIEILNIPVHTTGYGSSVITESSVLDKALTEYKDDRLALTAALNLAISPVQKVTSPALADTIVSTDTRKVLGIDDEVTLLHPGRDMEAIQAMLF